MKACDRCGVRALWIVWVRNGHLYFCGHHFKQHLEHIAQMGYRSHTL